MIAMGNGRWARGRLLSPLACACAATSAAAVVAAAVCVFVVSMIRRISRAYAHVHF